METSNYNNLWLRSCPKKKKHLGNTFYTKHQLKTIQKICAKTLIYGFGADFLSIVLLVFRKKLIKAKRSFCHFEKWQKRINQRFLSLRCFASAEAARDADQWTSLCEVRVPSRKLTVRTKAKTTYLRGFPAP